MSLQTQVQLPTFFRLRQEFASHAIGDIPAAVRDALDQASLSQQIKPGQCVAITAGSRGISNLAMIVGEVVNYVSGLGANPMIVPAMGSHGGATAAGQAAMLASFGIDEQAMGCPIVSSMETVLLGSTDDGVEIHFDKSCSQADHVIVVNRVKPHTRLAGKIESGINKMLMIGLGKHRGAQTYHQAFPHYGYCLDGLVSKIVPTIVNAVPITLGLAIVEDAFDQTSLIEAIAPQRLLLEEPRLLEIARRRMPRLPFDHVDLLIVDQIGKEISGTGMDTNVIGRKANDKGAGPDELPKVREIYVRSLTRKSAGNGCGIGIAEYCHANFVREMSQAVTRINCVTSGHPTAGAVPIHFESDREVLQAVISQVGHDSPAEAVKWMRISDTLHLSELACSSAYWEEARKRPDLEVLSEPAAIDFDDAGDFV